MAQIIINEVSQNYTYNIGTTSYCSVALPITASWGPAFRDFNSESVLSKEEWESKFKDIYENKIEWMQEQSAWTRFPATQSGLEAFVSTYRGPAAGHRLAKDFSYQMAMTLLISGHDVWCCRLCPGERAEGRFVTDNRGKNVLIVKAKYPGTFGNNIQIEIKPTSRNRRIVWTYTVYAIDAAGVKTAVEHAPFLFNVTEDHLDAFGDTIQHIKEVNSKFVDFELIGRFYNGIGEETGIRATEPIDLRFYTGEVDSQGNPLFDANGNFVKDRIAAMTRGQIQGGTDRRLLEDADGNPIVDGDGNVVIPKIGGEYTSGLIRQAVKTACTRYGGVLTSIYPDMLNGIKWGIIDGSEAEGASPNTIEEQLQLVYAQIEYISVINDKTNPYPTIGDGLDPDGNPYDLPSTATQDDIDAWVKDHKITEQDEAEIIEYKEWLYTMSMYAYDLLRDKLVYNPKRVISPGWDDQDFNELDGEGARFIDLISPMHKVLMDTAYYSRCATAYIDIPKSAARNAVYRDNADAPEDEGYAQMLSRLPAESSNFDVNVVLYHTHSALFAPWGQYQYSGTNKQNAASPSFQALMIDRGMILNQAIQYEWLLPNNRKHNIRLGTLDYKVPKKLLDIWQKLEGVGVNVITQIPDIGIGLWGNSTLFEVPPVTYNALSNLSTRKLMNAVKDIAYKCGLTITFQYNNEQAYNKFYAGVTPLLDTMKNVGAIEDYYVRMQADINGLDQVNANTVIGKIYLVVNGVINDIIVDLIALPPGTDLDQYRV